MDRAQFRLFIASCHRVVGDVRGLEVHNGHPHPQFLNWEDIPSEYLTWTAQQALLHSLGFSISFVGKVAERVGSHVIGG